MQREREKRREMATLGGARACGGAAVRARSAGFGQASTRRAGVVPVLPSRSRPATTTRAAAWREAWSRLVEDERLPGPEVRAEDLPKLGSQAGWRASAKTAAAPVAFALQATLFGTVLDVSPVPPRPLPRMLAQSEKSRPDRRSLSLCPSLPVTGLLRRRAGQDPHVLVPQPPPAAGSRRRPGQVHHGARVPAL